MGKVLEPWQAESGVCMVLCRRRGKLFKVKERVANLCSNPEWVFCLGFGPFFFLLLFSCWVFLLN